MEQEFSPADINTKINEYKEVIMHFAALLENENQALRAYNIDAVTALLEEKTKLVLWIPLSAWLKSPALQVRPLTGLRENIPPSTTRRTRLP